MSSSVSLKRSSPVAICVTRNSLTGLSPGFFRVSAALCTLVLKGNQLKFLEASWLHDLKALRHLDLSENQLHSLPPGLLENFIPPPTARAFCLGPASYGACLDPQRALPSVLGQQDSAQTKLQALLSVMVTLQNLLLCSSISSIRL